MLGPFADCLAIDLIRRRAANDRCEGIRFSVDRKICEFKRLPEKLVGFAPRFLVFGDGEHGFQIPIHGIASTAGLKVVPRAAHLLKPSPNANF
jgi:hypothetical protein